MTEIRFRYRDGTAVGVGDAVGIDALDGRGVVTTGTVSKVLLPGSPESKNFACWGTGGILILFDDGDCQLWVEPDDHLVRI